MPANLFHVEEQDELFLKHQWDNLASSCVSDKTITDHIYQVLKEKYSEKSRFYHNLSHVKTLLSLYESVHSHIHNHQAIQFSIWFHDVVYNTQRRDNEVESARAASAMLSRLQVNAETMELVNGLILATIYHGGVNLSPDAKLFLDMDLAILGASEEIYDEYSRAIRKEYSWVSESMYRTGRKKVLGSFIERERIYCTDEMKIRYEKQARTNINREIKSLDARKKTRVSSPADS